MTVVEGSTRLVVVGETSIVSGTVVKIVSKPSLIVTVWKTVEYKVVMSDSS